MKALKAFIKPFEAPRRSVKIKFIELIFSLHLGSGRALYAVLYAVTKLIELYGMKF